MRNTLFSVVTLLALALPAHADPYTCERIDPDTRRAVPYFDAEITDTAFTLFGKKRKISGSLVQNDNTGRVFVASDYLIMVYGPPRKKGSKFVANKGPVAVVMVYRDPVGPAIIELTCNRADQ